MTSDPSGDAADFACATCGTLHADPPMAYAAPAPDAWHDGFANDPASELTSDQCVIKGEHFFVKGLVEIPVTDSGEVFSWGVWASLSRENFARARDLRQVAGREAERPYFGWLNTHLAVYSPTTVALRTHVRTRALGTRPLIELEPTDHPLAVEQRTGITRERVREIAELLLHQDSARSDHSAQSDHANHSDHAGHSGHQSHRAHTDHADHADHADHEDATDRPPS